MQQIFKGRFTIKRINKTINLLLPFLFSFTILLAVQTDTTFTGRVYKYPQVEGKKWEREIAYQLPDTVLYGYTTVELLHTCFNYPLLLSFVGDTMAYSDYSIGVGLMFGGFNGFFELVKRDDSFNELVKKYYETNNKIKIIDTFDTEQRRQIEVEYLFIQYLLTISNVYPPSISKLIEYTLNNNPLNYQQQLSYRPFLYASNYYFLLKCY